MRLVAQGKLDLDRKITDYIPRFTLRKAGAADHVTLRLLLSHKAGLPEGPAVYNGRRDPQGLEAHVREDIARYPLVAPPGTLYSYSNLGVNLAGYVAEIVSGQPFPDLMQALVFDPLEMNRTTFDPTVAMTYPLAQAHDLQADGTLRIYHDPGDNTANYPGAFAMSTAIDLANFMIMLMQQGRFGGRQILSPASVSTMYTPHADLYLDSGLQYGLTWNLETYKGIRRVFHEGGYKTVGSKIIMALDARVAAVLLYNRDRDFGEMRDATLDLVFDQLLDLPHELPSPPVVEPDRSLWPRYTGLFSRVFEMAEATIRVVDDQLTLEFHGALVPLTARTPHLYVGPTPDYKDQNVAWQRIRHFKSKTISVGFIPEPAGSTRYLMINARPYKRLR
jgi:CubicO group peptidase (beta-lactamase class C family)